MEKKYTVTLTYEEANSIRQAMLYMQNFWADKAKENPDKKEVYNQIENEYIQLEGKFHELIFGLN